MDLPDFKAIAALPAPALDELALALATEFRPGLDVEGAREDLDRLGAELAELTHGAAPEEQARACRRVLGLQHGFAGDRERYDHPDNSMLDLVLARRRGLPILLSVVYVEAARRAGFELAGVGLPGHYVVGHFGVDPPLLLDPFSGGTEMHEIAPAVAESYVRPWGAHETGLRMLNNLTAAYSARGDLSGAIRAAQLRLDLPLDEAWRAGLTAELRSLQARLN